MASLIGILSKNPQDLLVPNEDLKAVAFKAVKESLDPIASQYSIFDQLHIEDLDAEQIWAQARMIVDGTIEKLLADVMSKKRKYQEVESEGDSEEDSEGDGEDDSQDEDEELEVGELEDEELEEDSEDEELEGELEDEDLENDDLENDDLENDDLENDDLEEDEDEPEPTSELDQGLFRLADFQQQILALENDGQNDEEINYFGNLDSDSESDNDMKYDDFFAPPPKTKKTRPQPTQSEDDFSGLTTNAKSNDIDRAMKNATKELFDSDEEDDASDVDTTQLSTFEKQQQEIMKQIKELEQENIAQKSWEVRGEVKAKDRPLDSLIETDLDFERNAKPVPVITQEVTESLEDMIRRRIKNEEYDDIARRLPDTLPEFRKTKLVDVDETKSQKSLAELYEEDYVKENNPDAYKEEESEHLKEAHKEIVDLFNSVSRKLDALCSWNYTPKAPKPTISIVSNAPAISMEDAQPLAMSTETMLAPQEVYKPGTEKDKREVVGANGLPVAKAEMTREERKREKRRQKNTRGKLFKEKEEKDKARAAASGGKAKESKSNIIDTLKRGNVTVIGKKGEKRDVSGKLVKDQIRPEGSNLKL